MGGGLSKGENISSKKSVNKEQKYVEECKANHVETIDNGNLSERRLQCVETFVQQVYLLKKNEEEATTSIMLNKQSRSSFLEYVEASSKKAQTADKPDLDDEVLRNAIEKLKAYDDETITAPTARDKIKVINKLNKFGDYILAPAYHVWRASESGLANEAIGDQMARSIGEVESPHHDNFVQNIFACMNDEDLKKAVESSTWIIKFITSVEMLPLGIIIVNHHNGEEYEGKRLSIMYVNRQFETITGYSKNEAIGKDPKFLQGAETSPQQVIEMASVIRDVCSYSSTVCNYRKDGEEFFNHICFKPITDQDQKCQYWIGLMEDVSNHDESDLRHLIDTLPNRVIINQH
jgi:PAS domain S-box-containing protein